MRFDPRPFRVHAIGVALLVAIVGGACTCTPKKPVMETLKKEGEACMADDRCETGLCDGAPPVCVRKCSIGCKTEEVCTQLTPGRFSCQPDQRRLCQACQLDSDCPYPADKCVVVNGEKVCGRDCAFDQSCPTGYVCVNGRGSDGMTKVQQCSPMVASCTTSAWRPAAGLLHLERRRNLHGREDVRPRQQRHHLQREDAEARDVQRRRRRLRRAHR